MNATSIPASPEPHKMRDSFHAAPAQPCQAAFQTRAHDGEMSSQNAAAEPLHLTMQGESRGMRCIPTKYLRGKAGLSRVQIALLAYVLDNPVEQGDRAKIAEDCDCAPNSIPRAAKRLVELELIERTPGGGSASTSYRLGRNMEVTHNLEVTAGRNLHDTRNSDVTNVTETNAADQASNSEVTGGRNMPPPHPPYINTSSLFQKEAQPSNTEPSFKGGVGELFGDAKPKRKRSGTRRRPKVAKFYASEETMPTEPNAAMADYAASKKLINGTRGDEFGKFRRYHIRKQTLIACIEQRWETWVDNWASKNPVRPDGAPPGYKLLGYGGDGQPRYAKNQRTNFYRG